MQLSLELLETPAPPVHLWEALTQDQREAVVAALASLMAKTGIREEDVSHE
ncbi:MAG: hypothetical protein ACRDJO_11105 [Actinomycetota bacterium]